MKSSTKCFIVTTLHSLKVTSIDHQKYGEIWKSNIKMFWNSQYNVTQELSTSHQAHSRRKTLNKLWKYCNMEGGNFSRTKSVSLSFSTESEVFVSELWMDKKNIENITNDLLVATGLSLLYSGNHKNCSGCYKKLYFYHEKFQNYK